jgi:peptide/nickel transport system substrate-binding protein
MDPRETSTIDVVQNIYETLTYLAPNGTVTPGLATSWTHNSDFTSWQYNLRQGVTFHDGTPFNSTSVVYSINEIVKYGGGDAPAVWDTFSGVTANGPYSVTITTSQPTNLPVVTAAAYAAFMFSPNIMKYSGAANDTSGLHTWFLTLHDDGSGPYQIDNTASSISGQQIVLKAYNNYWGGWHTGQVTQIIVKTVSNVNTAVLQAQSGQLDMIGISGQYQYVPQLLQSGLQVESGPSFSAIWILFNTQHPYLNNPLVRRALLTALNFNQIVDQAYYGYGNEFPGIINPGKPFYNPNAPNFPVGGNITLAKQLMKEAGYPGGLNVTWTVTYSTGSPFLGTAAQLMETFWQPFGIKLNIQGEGFASVTKQAGYFNQTTGAVFQPGPISYANSSAAQDIVLLNWVGATADPWLVPNELFAIQSPPYQNDILFNWSYWRNSTFTALLNQARLDEANPAVAQPEWDKLNNMFYQASPGWGMFAENQVWVLSPHLQGYVANPYYGFDYIFYYHLTYV